MTNALRSELASLLICIVLVLILIFLFIFPRQYLNSFLNDITYCTLNTRDGIMANDEKKVTENAEKMIFRFEEASKLLKLFLNHEDVDDLGLYINSCYYSSKADEIDLHVMIDNIENILKKCEYLFDVETLSLYNLF